MTKAGPAVLLVLLLAACTSTANPPSSPATASPTPSTNQAALATYGEFWRVTDAARAAPKAQNWEPQIAAVASGQALQTALTDVRNYASLPAHTVGTITRTPAVTSATDRRAEILDCVDLGDSRLVSDTNGSALDDLTHRVQRFRLRAVVEVGPDGHWLVTTTTPLLDERC